MQRILLYLIVMGLGAAPFAETRAGILFGIAAGLNPYIVLILAILGNVLEVPVSQNWKFRYPSMPK